MIELYNALSAAEANARGTVLTVIGGEDFGDKALFSGGRLVWEQVENGFFARRAGAWDDHKGVGEITVDGRAIFYETLGGEKKLVICGAGHVALPLIRLGGMLGFTVTVLEDRSEFARRAEEAGAARVICAPFTEGLCLLEGDEDSYFCVLTRGHSFDLECMDVICRKPHAYIGMIGSKRHGEFVMQSLRERGISEEVLAEIHTPIGLKIGSETPEEIAVSISAELIQEKSRLGRESAYPGKLLRAIAGEEAAHAPKALLTIVARRGSAPGRLGGKLLLLPDGHSIGTVGGGGFEYAATRRAKAMLSTGKTESELFEQALDAERDEAGMVCGGSQTVLIEIIESRD